MDTGFPTYRNEEFGKYLYHTSDGRWNFSSVLEPARSIMEHEPAGRETMKLQKARGIAHMQMHGKGGEVPTGERQWQGNPPPRPEQSRSGAKSVKLTIEEIVDKPGFHDSPRHISGHKLNIKQGDPSRKEVEGKCILEYNDPGRCDVIAVDPVRHATGAVQLADHLEVNGIYRAFEVKILATGANGLAEVGVGLAYDFDEADGEDHGDLESQPGWNNGSVGYHCDNGKLYEGSDEGHESGPKCKAGDVICCGLRHPAHGSGAEEVECWFTVNGFHVGTARLSYSGCPTPAAHGRTARIYPTVALSGKGEKVQVLVKRSAPNPFADKAGGLVETEPLCVRYNTSPYTPSGRQRVTVDTPSVRQLLFTVTRGMGGVAHLYSVSAVQEPKNPRHCGVVVSKGNETVCGVVVSKGSAEAAFDFANKGGNGLDAAGLQAALLHLGAKPLPTLEELQAIMASTGPNGMSKQDFVKFCVSLSEGYVLRRVNGQRIDDLMEEALEGFDVTTTTSKQLLTQLEKVLENYYQERGELELEFKDCFEVALDSDDNGHDPHHSVFKRAGLTVPYDAAQGHHRNATEARKNQRSRYIEWMRD